MLYTSKSLYSAFYLSLLFVIGCNLNDVTDISQEAIEGSLVEPKHVETAEGARLVYLGSIAKFNRLTAVLSEQVARFTDEVSLPPNRAPTGLDNRIGLDDRSASGEIVPYVTVSRLYGHVQESKVQLEQAAYLLREYAPQFPNMQAHAYGLLGMTYLIIADNFCSGIALSESQWGGHFNPGRGFEKDEIYQAAIEWFDTGLELGTDSAEVIALLSVGKARALNSLGRYDEAAEVASKIATEDSTTVIFYINATEEVSFAYPRRFSDTTFIVINNKGSNGMAWVESSLGVQDSRVAMYEIGNIIRIPYKPRIFFSDNYINIASGVEARLIEAEALLNIGEITGFIDKINSVRRLYKTTDGVQLSDTTDPGSFESRLNLLYRERAYTFYLAGRRLGDMRKLIAAYGRSAESVFPTGLAEGAQRTTYGSNYVFAPEIPDMGSEAELNPHYSRCSSYEP